MFSSGLTGVVISVLHNMSVFLFSFITTRQTLSSRVDRVRVPRAVHPCSLNGRAVYRPLNPVASALHLSEDAVPSTSTALTRVRNTTTGTVVYIAALSLTASDGYQLPAARRRQQSPTASDSSRPAGCYGLVQVPPSSNCSLHPCRLRLGSANYGRLVRPEDHRTPPGYLRSPANLAVTFPSFFNAPYITCSSTTEVKILYVYMYLPLSSRTCLAFECVLNFRTNLEC